MQLSLFEVFDGEAQATASLEPTASVLTYAGRYLLWARISSTPSTDAKKQFRQRLARARKQASRTHQPERHKGTRSVPFATQKVRSCT